MRCCPPASRSTAQTAPTRGGTSRRTDTAPGSGRSSPTPGGTAVTSNGGAEASRSRPTTRPPSGTCPVTTGGRNTSRSATCPRSERYGGLRAIADSSLLDDRRAGAAAAAARSIRAEVLRTGVSAPSAGPAHLVKWLGSSAIDGSLSACVVPFSLVDAQDPVASATLGAIRKDLDVEGLSLIHISEPT